MKNFKFFVAALAVVATLFVSCEKQVEGTDQTKATMVVTWDGTELQDGATVTVTEAEYGEMIAHLAVENTGKRPIDVTLNEIRRFDSNAKGSALCTDVCIPGDSNSSQLWNVGTIYPEVKATADYHLYLKQGATTTNSEADLIFSDGTTEIKILVKFVL